jgi:hypothetical protein
MRFTLPAMRFTVYPRSGDRLFVPSANNGKYRGQNFFPQSRALSISLWYCILRSAFDFAHTMVDLRGVRFSSNTKYSSIPGHIDQF